MEEQKFTREELYSLIWSQSLLSLSKKYDISDVGIRKVCMRLNIPIPPRGYWEKVKYGKKAQKPPLPISYQYDHLISWKFRDPQEQKRPTIDTTAYKSKESIEQELKKIIKAKTDFESLESIVAETHQVLLSREVDRELYIDTVSSPIQKFDVRVSVNNITKVIGFLDKLVKSVQNQGYRVKFDHYGTYIIIDDEHFKLHVHEKMKAGKYELNLEDGRERYCYRPGGEIEFDADSRKWKTGKVSLEKMIPSILHELRIRAGSKKAWRIEDEKRKVVVEEEREKEQTFKKQRENELDSFKKILDDSVRWRMAMDLRDYITALEQQHLATGQTLPDEITQWLSWARQKADWYDPIIKAKDPLFKNVSRRELRIIDWSMREDD